MKILVHRGAAQIGGNCIELQTAQAKILVDFGLPLDFDELSKEEQQKVKKDAAAWAKEADAVFISHAHADHYGLLTELHRDIPVFMSRETRILLQSNPFNRIDTARLNIVTFPVQQKFGFKDINITAYTVDHSAYGACAFFFEAEGKTLLYTGDIRTHGAKGSLYKNLPVNPDYLLIEGTNVREGEDVCYCKENALQKKFEAEFRKSPEAIHTVWCSGQNIARIVTILRACIKCGKQLVVDAYTAYILNEIAKLNPKIPNPAAFHNVKIYFPQRLMTALTKLDHDRYTVNLDPKANKVTYTVENFKDTASGYVLLVRDSAWDFLKEVKKRVSHIKLTLSTWRGYWDNPNVFPQTRAEAKLTWTLPSKGKGRLKTNTKRLAAFRSWAEKNCEITEDIHTSGHADIAGLKDIITHVSPGTIIPVHTENAASYKKILGLTQKVKVLKDGEEVWL